MFMGSWTLIVTPYPAAWRIDVVDDDKHRGFEYIRSGVNVTRAGRHLVDTA